MKTVLNIEQIWDCGDINKKKDMLYEAVKSFQYKKKIPLFIESIRSAKTVKQLDNIALNIHMAGQGLTNI